MARETTGTTKLIAENRRSRHDYELLERVEAGIVLSGTEVKALRAGHAQLGRAFADVRGGEMWLIGASISEYAQGGPLGHQSDRDRKLLLHRGEIDSLYGKVREKGLTLVPTRMYFKDGRVKVEIALARGRERADKRRVIADRDAVGSSEMPFACDYRDAARLDQPLEALELLGHDALAVCGDGRHVDALERRLYADAWR